MNIISLERKEVPNYLIKNFSYLDEETVILKFKFEKLDKVFKYTDTGEKMQNPGKINLVRVRPNGIDGFRSNNLKHCTEKNKHWSCTWLYITDTDLKLI